jgi:(+)-pinoresinol hydroxylase
MNGQSIGVLALGLLMGSPAAALDQAPIGRSVYEHYCSPCHASGPGHPGTQALDALYNGNPSGLLEQRHDLTPELITITVRQGRSVMPSFRKTEIDDAQLRAVAIYLTEHK